MNKNSQLHIKKRKTPFVIIDKTCLHDTNLSWQAKGLLCYLISLPEDWKLYMRELATHSRNGYDSTRNIMKELINNRYVERIQIRDENTGRVKGYDYFVYETPQPKNGLEDNYNESNNNEIESEKNTSSHTETPVISNDSPVCYSPQTKNPSRGFPCTENPQLLNNNNTEYINTNIKNKTKSESEEQIENLPQNPPQSKNEVEKVYINNTQTLIDNIKAINPKNKMPTEKQIKKWYNDMRLMFEQDNRTQEEFNKLINFIYKDSSFWASNILSVSKLRQKFDQIWMHMLEHEKRKNKPPQQQYNNKPAQHLNFEQRDPNQYDFDSMLANKKLPKRE